MILVVCGLAAFVVAFVILWKEAAAKTRPRKLSKLAGAAAVVLIATLLLLAASGRLPWLAALAAGALPFLRWLASLLIGPMIGKWLRAAFGGFGGGGWGGPQADAAPGPQVSTVTTADLRMTLQHESGDLDGEVLSGAHAGARLSTLDLDVLRTLRGAFEPDSVQLLDAYLDRRFAGWRDADDAADACGAAPSAPAMDKRQALQVLGLAEGATQTEVVDAHRRLMQKLHPDRGGTDYLAATLNQAKDVLLSGS